MMAMQLLANCAIHRLEVVELVVFWDDSLLPWTKMDLLVHATSPSLQPEEVVPAAHPARVLALQAAVQSQLPLFDELAAQPSPVCVFTLGNPGSARSLTWRSFFCCWCPNTTIYIGCPHSIPDEQGWSFLKS